jgi:transposase-like protein
LNHKQTLQARKKVVHESTAKQWLNAVKIFSLSVDVKQKVPCPECGSGILTVRDIPWRKNFNYFERYLECNICSKTNVIRMHSSTTNHQIK